MIVNQLSVKVLEHFPPGLPPHIADAPYVMIDKEPSKADFFRFRVLA